MLENPPVLTIHRGFRRADKQLIDRFHGAQTSHLADAMDGRGALDYRIKPLDPSTAIFAGPAITAFAYPADVMAVFGALAEAEPGDVIIVANDAFTRTAVLGDIAAGMMKNKGVAAFVTDGLARDKAGIIATGLPVFCQGIQPNSPAMNGPGVVGAPITLSDVHVEPGDIVVGDADGVVVVPVAQAERVLQRLAAIRAAEERTLKAVADGAVMAAGARRFIEQATIIER
ncbi:RraA family protein [Rhodopila sp.]|jgi:regulator of RNase E activity RraA|uniref:RraA family protein n=1 Tax=Rhodopila sp. TaxID=2480087 RepID=UPI002B93B8ED|nr:RraA family protein [Rhodopila sp.]HVZ07427.1 RraA family protein [Rhodopila sp.]